MNAPSGEQIEIALGAQRAVVVEVGAALRSHSVAGVELLDGFGPDEMSHSGRGQVLIPWPNRVEQGSYEFGGERHQLALNEPERGNAIHGLVRWVGWTAAEREPHRVVMEHQLRPQPGYPFSLALAVEYTLAEDGLRVRTTATNIGPDPCPFGSGAHPYLRAGPATVDEVVLTLPASTVLRANENGIPIGSVPVDGTAHDFREPRAIGDTVLDHAFTDLERGDDGIARVQLRDAAGGGLDLWVDQSYPYLMVFTGDPLPDVNRRSLAVEPMTCPPNALRTGEAVVTLQPGEALTGTWGITPLAAAA
jgi:aldose 1-epimerase